MDRQQLKRRTLHMDDKLAEIWSLLTESPQTFKGGQVWGVMTGIHGALQAIGYGLLVLFLPWVL